MVLSAGSNHYCFGKVSLLLLTQMYVDFTPFMQYIWSNILVGKFIIHVFQ